MKRLLALLLVLTMLFALAACGSSTDPVVSEPPGQADPTPAPPPGPEVTEKYESYDVRSYASDWEYHEICYVGNNEDKYVDMPYYALENVVYCTDPVDENFQVMNIYVPANYMTEDGTGKVSMNGKRTFYYWTDSLIQLRK